MTKKFYTQSMFISLLLLFSKAVTLDAMQHHEKSSNSAQKLAISAAYTSACVTGNIALKVGSCAAHLFVNHPALTTGTLGLAIITVYKTIPQSQAPLRSMATWTSKKLYDAYHAVAYEIYVAPIIAQNKDVENNIKGIEQNVSKLQEQHNILSQSKIDIATELSSAHNELHNIAVRPDEIRAVAVNAQKAAHESDTLRTITHVGLTGCMTGLNKNNTILKAQAYCFKRMSEQLTIPVQIVMPASALMDCTKEKEHEKQCLQETQYIHQETDTMLSIAEQIKRNLKAPVKQ